MQDPILGALHWNAKDEEWHANIPQSAGDVQLRITGRAPADVAMERARAIVRDFARWEAKARLFAVKVLLPVHNGSWNEGPEITPAEFVQRMRCTSVLVFEDGGADFYYADGDLFWGHTILVSCNEAGSFHHAEIAG